MIKKLLPAVFLLSLVFILVGITITFSSCGPKPIDPCQLANAGPDKTIKFGERIEIGANDYVSSASYTWFPKLAVMSPYTHKTLVAPSQTSVYMLKVVNQCGISSASIKVTVIP